MIINLEYLDCDVEYIYQGPQIGGSYSDAGEVEILSAYVTITSVKCKGIEIIDIIPKDLLLVMEQDKLREITH